MRRVVIKAFFDFNVPFEGYTTYMYLDIKRLVTTGVGNLIDPVGYAEVLPWRRPDGSLASLAEIRSAFNKVKGDKTLDEKRGGAQYVSLTSIRITRADVEILVKKKLLENDSRLRARFKKYDSWPADAQLGVLSMAWAMGDGGFAKFPMFCAAAAKSDFMGMAGQCEMGPKVGSIVERNKANKQLFENAARVIREGLDPEVLLYGSTATKAP